MDKKSDICELWHRASSLVYEVCKSADMTSNIKALENNGEILKERAKVMMTKLVDTFYMQLEKSLKKIVGEKKALLEYHALEVQQYVTHMKTLCNTAECYLQGYNVHIAQYGPKLKKELELCIEQAGEFNSIDYETFTSLELEANLKNLMKVPVCNIVNINKLNQEKQVLEVLYFDNLLQDETKELQNNLANTCAAEMVVKQTIPKPLDTNESNTLVKCEVNVLETFASNSSSLPEDSNKNLAKTEMKTLASNSSSLPEDSNKNLAKTEMKTFASNSSSLPEHTDKNLTKIEMKTFASNSSSSPKDTTKNLVKTEIKTLASYSSRLPEDTTKNLAKTEIKTLASYSSRLPEDTDKNLANTSSKTLAHNSFSLSEDTNKNVAKTSPPLEETKMYGKARATNSKELFAVTVSPCMSSKTPPLPGKQASSVQEDSLKNNIAEAKNCASKSPFSVSSNFNSNHNGVSANQLLVKSVSDDLAACKITSKSKDEIFKQPTTSTGDSIVMNFDLRTFMKTSPYSANEIEAQLIRKIKDYGDGTFDHPTGLTVNKDGQLIVTDTGNNMVKVLEDKHLVFTIGDKDGVEFYRPSAVVSDAVGNIYVKDDKCIKMFNSKGNYLHTIGKGVLQQPYGLSLTEVDEDNVLVLIDAAKRAQSVYHYNIRQDELKSYRYEPLIQFGQPTSKVRFLATYKNLILASDLGASCMYLSTTQGECLSAFGSFGYHAGHFKEPSGVTVDCSGNWIVGDSKNNRLQIFNKEGDFLAHLKLSCPIRRPSGIHLTNDGKLFVINYLDSEILVFQLY